MSKDQKIRLIASGINNFTVESYYPDDSFSLTAKAEYDTLLEHIENVAETLTGELTTMAKSLAGKVNEMRYLYTGKKYWQPALETSIFKKNEPLAFQLPFIFSSENVADDNSVKGATYAEKNLNRIRKLINLTSPTKTDSYQLVMPGPHLSYKKVKETAKKEGRLKSAWQGVKSIADADRDYNTKVVFQIGNWFRIPSVIVTDVEAKIHPVLDRYQHYPFYMECNVSIQTPYPPTAQDVNSWFLIKTNRS